MICPRCEQVLRPLYTWPRHGLHKKMKSSNMKHPMAQVYTSRTVLRTPHEYQYKKVFRVRWLRVRFMERIFVHGRATLGTQQKATSSPSQNHGASIRPWNEIHSPKNIGVNKFVRGTNTISKTWGRIIRPQSEYYRLDQWISRIFVKSIRFRSVGVQML